MHNVICKQLLTAQCFYFPKPLMNYLGNSSSSMLHDRPLLIPGSWHRLPQHLLGIGFWERHPHDALSWCCLCAQAQLWQGRACGHTASGDSSADAPCKGCPVWNRSPFPELEEQSSPAPSPPPPPALSSPLLRLIATCSRHLPAAKAIEKFSTDL